MAQKFIEGDMSHVKSYALEIEMAQFQNGSKSRSRVFLLRWLTSKFQTKPTCEYGVIIFSA